MSGIFERSDFNDVALFHEKFDLDNVSHHGPGPRDMPRELVDFRLRFLIEELREVAAGLGVELVVTTHRVTDQPVVNMVEVADGLVDLNYVSLGTAHLFGIPWEDVWNEVQRANMAKERASHAADQRSTRKSSLDVVKPLGWKKPDVEGALRRHGFKV
jgi:predicted HAD superfamily Cof-like phosphohydrolase